MGLRSDVSIEAQHQGAAISCARRGRPGKLECCVGQEFSAQACFSDESTPTPPVLSQHRRFWASTSPLRLDCAAIRCQDSLEVESSASGEVREAYEMLEVIGRGSTGIVRRARRKADGTEIALKTILTRDPAIAQIAKQEFELLRSLQHPNIIRGYDLHLMQDRVFLALEYFPGKTLQSAIQESERGKFSEEESMPLFEALLSAVAHIHEAGIAHRDIKAENVLVACDLSGLRLIDFNTAQQVAIGGTLTMTGTREWASPEVLLGNSPDQSSDIWSMGLCLYFMLAGRLPRRSARFRGLEEYANAVSKAHEDFVRSKWRHVSLACKETLRYCLAAEPQQRAEANMLISAGFWPYCGACPEASASEVCRAPA